MSATCQAVTLISSRTIQLRYFVFVLGLLAGRVGKIAHYTTHSSLTERSLYCFQRRIHFLLELRTFNPRTCFCLEAYMAAAVIVPPINEVMKRHSQLQVGQPVSQEVFLHQILPRLRSLHRNLQETQGGLPCLQGTSERQCLACIVLLFPASHFSI